MSPNWIRTLLRRIPTGGWAVPDKEPTRCWDRTLSGRAPVPPLTPISRSASLATPAVCSPLRRSRRGTSNCPFARPAAWFESRPPGLSVLLLHQLPSAVGLTNVELGLRRSKLRRFHVLGGDSAVQPSPPRLRSGRSRRTILWVGFPTAVRLRTSSPRLPAKQDQCHRRHVSPLQLGCRQAAC
jgi:hypothetical protein